MLGLERIRLLVLAATLFAAWGQASDARAAWVTIQNDTKGVIVVQSATTVNGQVRRGKPVRLLPGESVREFYAPPSIAMEVYDAQNPNKPLLTAPLTIKTENQAFSVAATPVGVVVAPVVEAPKKPDPAPKK